MDVTENAFRKLKGVDLEIAREQACSCINALPEEGSRMTKGSGRSACFRGGVTYGYREYLRKGRVR